ncbi:MAG: very short patch repair endonuclease [Paludibacteraceae bacterium]|nr:very short patch repair endonuclease [Paludibacteraceae bacterium]
MPDKLTPQQRHKCMSRIRSKNTKPELLVRRWLWADGFRYRLYVRNLPGSPDIVFKKYKIALFINGCFWHGHKTNYEFGKSKSIDSSECCKIPKSRTDFWMQKILRNKERDVINYIQLKNAGWNVLVVWECQLKGKEQQAQTLKALSYQINSIILKSYSKPESYDLKPDSDYLEVAEADKNYGR